MDNRLRSQAKAPSLSSPKSVQTSLFQPRPFYETVEETTESLDSSHQPPNLQTQSDGAARLGHNFSRIPVHVNTSAVVQLQPLIGQAEEQQEQETSSVAEPLKIMAPPLGQPLAKGSLENDPIQMMPQLGMLQRLPREEDEPIQMMPQGGTLQRLLQKENEPIQMKWVQPRLTVGAPGDKYEQEADAVAAQVMSMSIPAANSALVQRQGEEEEPPLVQRSLAASITPFVQRQTEELEESIQTKSLLQQAGSQGNAEVGHNLENQLSSSKGGGSPLADDVRAFMEPRFGADFSQVRVHTDSEAAQMNQDLHAQAFTHGQDIYFSAGKSPSKDALTAHELTHVVQQTHGEQQRTGQANQNTSTVQQQSSSTIQRFKPPASSSTTTDTGTETGTAPTASDKGTTGSNGNAPSATGGTATQTAPDAGSNRSDPKAPSPDGGSAKSPSSPQTSGGAAGAADTKSPGTQPGTPAPQTPTGPDPFGMGYTKANAYQNKLDEKLSELFEQRVDPAQKERFEKLNAAADSARLSSLQFSFVPTGFGYQLLQSVVPADAVMEHFRQATTQNAYASSANLNSLSGAIAGVQTGIEFIRGIMKVVGDIVAGAGTGLGIFSLVTGALALIPPLSPVMAPIAGASAAAAELLAISKAVLDLFDTELSIVQIVLNILRARMSDSPAERARICQLMKKEADDISSNMTGIAIGVASLGLGKLIGKAGGAVGRRLEAATEKATVAGLRTTLQVAKPVAKFLVSTNITTPLKQASDIAKQVGTRYTFRYALKQAATIAGGVKNIVAPKLHPLLKELHLSTRLMSPRLVGVTGAGVGAGTGMGFSGTEVKAANKNYGDQGANTNTNAPTQNNAVPDAQPIGVGKVAYWPSVLKEFGVTREWIHNAQERMIDQHNLAKEDAGDKAKAVYLAYGGISKMGNRIMAAGATQAPKAAAGQDGAQKAAEQAQKADAKGKEADAKQQAGEAKAQEAKAKTDEGKNAAQGASAQKSTWDKVKAWTWEHTLGPVFNGIAAAQKWLNDVILKYALKAAGMKNSDLDLAGIERKAMDEKQADSKAEADAKDTQAQGPNIDEKAKQVREGATVAEQNAIQGMIDSLAWIQELDNWDQLLAAEQDAGSQYVDQAAQVLSAKSEGEDAGKTVRTEDVKPIVDGAEALKSQVAQYPGSIQSDGQQEIQNFVGNLSTTYPGMPTGQAASTATAALSSLLEQGKSIANTIPPQIEAILAGAQSAIGTPNHEAVRALTLALSTETKKFLDLRQAVLAGLDQVLQEIADEYQAFYNAAVAKASTNDGKTAPAEEPNSNNSASSPQPTSTSGQQ